MEVQATMWHGKKMNENGQNLVEYAIVVTIIAAAMVSISTYVFRAVQATQQKILQEFAQ